MVYEDKCEQTKEKGVLPTPVRQLFQIYGSIFKPDPSCDCGQTSVVCITHGVFLLGVREYTLNALLALSVELFGVFVLSDFLRQIQILLPDVGGQQLLALLICSAHGLAWTIPAILRGASVGPFAVLVRGGMAKTLPLWTNIFILHSVIGIVPGLVSILLALRSCVRQNGHSAVIESFLYDPGSLVACVHGYELHFFVLRCH